MMGPEEIEFNLRVHVDEASTLKMKQADMTAQQFTRILYRVNHLMAHMGLGEDFNKAIGMLQRMVFTARMLQMSLNFLQMSTGYGLIMGMFGLATTAVAIREEIVDISQQWGSTEA